MPSNTVVALELGEIDRTEVLRYLGYRGQELTDAMMARIDELSSVCQKTARPRAAIRTFEIAAVATTEDGMPEITLQGSALRLVGSDIAHHLAGARAVGIMAVTLGTPFEQALRRTILMDSVAGIVLDAIGTAAIEQAADAAERLLAQEAHARRLFATWRYSPGYGDFPLATQRTLLATLDATRRLGITLTESLLMIPTKSVTAVVGMLDAPRNGERTGCATCSLRDRCAVRATGRTCHD